MPSERYYAAQPFHVGSSILLDEQEFHHLCHVMRNRVGDHVEVINGAGQLAQAHVDEISKKHAKLSITSSQTEEKKSAFPVILAQGIPRMNRLEFILEKATELGADEIWLVPTSRSEKKEISAHQLVRLEAILVTAMKQCGRLWLPMLKMVSHPKEWSLLPQALFFGDIDPKVPPFWEVWTKSKGEAGVVFCVGPESGFTMEEVDLLRNLGGKGVKLHDNILRTDTASIVALSLMSHWLLV